jgi:(R,R)-butanediol dehydrogenase / meso-butanediol dehydrogenase / diacetyl reductase
MRAAVYHGPLDVRVESVPEPAAPGPGELLLRVRRAAICGTDAAEYLHGPHLIPLAHRHPASGHCGPLVLGHEFVGEVVAAGGAVEGFAPGDRVVSGAGVSCGTCDWCRAGRTNLCADYYTLGLHAPGGLAEYVLSPARICVRVPDGCSDDAAALGQPLAVAIHGLRRGAVGAGETLAVIGAGGIGGLVLGAAAADGVTRRIAVDVDEQRLATARRLGATDAVAAAGAAERLRELTDGEGVHVAIKASDSEQGLATALASVRRGGRVVLLGLHARPRLVDLFAVTMAEVDLVSALAHVCAEDLPRALDVLSSTPLAAAATARTIPLEQLVDDGLRALAEHRTDGKILVAPA